MSGEAADIERIAVNHLRLFLAEGGQVLDTLQGCFDRSADRKWLVEQATELAETWPELPQVPDLDDPPRPARPGRCRGRSDRPSSCCLRDSQTCCAGRISGCRRPRKTQSATPHPVGCPRGTSGPAWRCTSIAVEPRQSALDHPASRQHLETFRSIGALDDLDGPAAQAAECRCELVAAIGAVGEQVPQPDKGGAHSAESRAGVPGKDRRRWLPHPPTRAMTPTPCVTRCDRRTSCW